jgi:hypothetical protein
VPFHELDVLLVLLVVLAVVVFAANERLEKHIKFSIMINANIDMPLKFLEIFKTLFELLC